MERFFLYSGFNIKLNYFHFFNSKNEFFIFFDLNI